MLALEIDDTLPDILETLDKKLVNKIKNSVCCHCGKVYGRGKMIMYVSCSKGEVRWWHTVKYSMLRRKTGVFHSHPCRV